MEVKEHIAVNLYYSILSSGCAGVAALAGRFCYLDNTPVRTAALVAGIAVSIFGASMSFGNYLVHHKDFQKLPIITLVPICIPLLTFVGLAPRLFQISLISTLSYSLIAGIGGSILGITLAEKT